MVKYDFEVKDGYSLFPEHLENDDLVFFHGSPMKNFKSICQNGFKSGSELRISSLTSVTYTMKSIGAFNHVCSIRQSGEDMVVFAVFFKKEDLERHLDVQKRVPIVVREYAEIKVYDSDIQPSRIGYSIVPAHYRHK
ncbi:hypothetical protein [Chlorobaculum parvum]|uniref:hypothetical protein n=1 Tax=Chlorobaculum parvum TaxID=274539 RepID=UPI00059C4E4B|nr:hypothetical protein [Chlorobaculum parvum]